MFEAFRATEHSISRRCLLVLMDGFEYGFRLDVKSVNGVFRFEHDALKRA